MQISTFQLLNYKSYQDSGELLFSSGFNVLVGQNNAGKTTLLDALSLKFMAKPHRSLAALPRATLPANPITTAKVVFSLSGEELKDILLGTTEVFYVPVPTELRGQGPQKFYAAIRGTLASKSIELCALLVTPPNQLAAFQVNRFPAHGLYTSQIDPPGKAMFYVVKPNNERSDFACTQDMASEPGSDFGLTTCAILRERIYSFTAQRFNVGRCAFGIGKALNSNASNLAEVLSVLQGTNPSLFTRFNQYVRQIFPTIYQISVRNVASSSDSICV